VADRGRGVANNARIIVSEFGSIKDAKTQLDLVAMFMCPECVDKHGVGSIERILDQACFLGQSHKEGHDLLLEYRHLTIIFSFEVGASQF
jgi:hypothetical protein